VILVGRSDLAGEKGIVSDSIVAAHGRTKFEGASNIRRLAMPLQKGGGMQYIVRAVPRPPTPDEQARARAEFWDSVQKLSMLLGLLVAIRSLSE
jgi:hypothetical protein